MSRVKVELPSLLCAATGGRDELTVHGDTLAEVFRALIDAVPLLGDHLFQEDGTFRPHVLCLHNQANVRWLKSLDVPVQEGDVLRVLQAVSGG